MRPQCHVVFLALVLTAGCGKQRPEDTHHAAGEGQAEPTVDTPDKPRTDTLGNTERLVIDVRTKREFDGDHLAGAIHIPYDQIGAKMESVAPKKDREIILYCATGARSGVAARELTRLGYLNVINGVNLRSVRKRLAGDTE